MLILPRGVWLSEEDEEECCGDPSASGIRGAADSTGDPTPEELGFGEPGTEKLFRSISEAAVSKSMELDRDLRLIALSTSTGSVEYCPRPTPGPPAFPFALAAAAVRRSPWSFSGICGTLNCITPALGSAEAACCCCCSCCN